MYEAFNIGKSFRLISPETEPGNSDRTDIIMARGAFGSGEHETTASCIELLEGLPALSDMKILDLGSGTAILSIAAIKLGANQSLCVDIDPDAVKSARFNCQINKIDAEIVHRCGTLASVTESQFDLVLGNIYGDILLDVCGDLVDMVRPGGMLLLSGILWEYNFDIRNKYEQAGCKVLENRMLEEFSTVLLEKRQLATC